MPRLSQKAGYLRSLEQVLIAYLQDNVVAGDNKLIDEASTMLAVIYSELQEAKLKRYPVPRSRVQKSNDWVDRVLPLYDEERFRIYARCSRSTFDFIFSQIENSPHFRNRSPNSPQLSIRQQLLTALNKLGSDGTGSAWRRSAALVGSSEGNTINQTRRVVHALFDLFEDWIVWGDDEDQLEESTANYKRMGFAGCIGKVDGTNVVLAYKPGGKFDQSEFYNYKSRWGLNLTCVFDTSKRIKFMTTGHTGSAHDSRVYGNSPLALTPGLYFKPGQYLLADSAYVANTTTIPQFKRPKALKHPYKTFGYLNGAVRIDAEHGFGMLKGRLASLCGLRLRIQTDEHYEYACRWITACCVLHNMFIHCTDQWTKDDGWWTDDDTKALEEAEEQEAHEAAIQTITCNGEQDGDQMRESVMAQVIEYNWDHLSRTARRAYLDWRDSE